jgi:hypothetical protein
VLARLDTIIYFDFTKNVYTYIQFIFNINVLLVRKFHSMSPAPSSIRAWVETPHSASFFNILR